MSDTLMLQYCVTADDEFGRHFEAYAVVNGMQIILTDIANRFYLEVMQQLVSNILIRMGTETKASWSSVVTDLED